MPTPAPPSDPMARKQQDKPTDVAPRLRAFIASKGYSSIRAAATASGLNYQQLVDILNGQIPRVDTLEFIVHEMGGTMVEYYSLKISG